MSQEYNLVQLDTIYLTDNGLVGGIPCRTVVTGLDAFALDKDGQITIAADGTPYAFIGDQAGIGSVIRIQPAVLAETVFENIKTMFNTAIGASTLITAKFTGDTGNFDLECLPAFPKPLEFSGEFFNSYIYGVSINVIVVSFNEV